MSLSRYNPLFSGFDEFFGHSNFFRNDPFFDSALMPVLRDWDRPDDMVLLRSSPGYEISEKDGKFQIAVDVPGVKASDINIELESDGRLLHISGGRKVQKDDSVSETRFDKRFTIGRDVDVEKMTANLADGVLVLTAPKKEEKPGITIAITEGPHA